MEISLKSTAAVLSLAIVAVTSGLVRHEALALTLNVRRTAATPRAAVARIGAGLFHNPAASASMRQQQRGEGVERVNSIADQQGEAVMPSEGQGASWQQRLTSRVSGFGERVTDIASFELDKQIEGFRRIFDHNQLQPALAGYENNKSGGNEGSDSRWVMLRKATSVEPAGRSRAIPTPARRAITSQAGYISRALLAIMAIGAVVTALALKGLFIPLATVAGSNIALTFGIGGVAAGAILALVNHLRERAGKISPDRARIFTGRFALALALIFAMSYGFGAALRYGVNPWIVIGALAIIPAFTIGKNLLDLFRAIARSKRA